MWAFPGKSVFPISRGTSPKRERYRMKERKQDVPYRCSLGATDLIGEQPRWLIILIACMWINAHFPKWNTSNKNGLYWHMHDKFPYGRICGMEITDEDSSHSGLVCVGGF